MTKSKHVLPLALTFLLASASGCPSPEIAYRQEMRDFVQSISAYAKARGTGFAVIPQNGQEIMSLDGEADGPVATSYMAAIDGIGREDLYYGFENDDVPTVADDRDYLLEFTALAESNGKTVLVTDYCSTHSKMDDSYTQNESRGYVSFAADARALNTIPDYPTSIHDDNTNAVESISDAQNMLYLINSGEFASRTAFLAAVDATNYDLFIIDLFAGDGAAYTASEIDALQTKPGGAQRQVICYMSIGEVEDYRYYWQTSWTTSPPTWLAAENPNWPGNFKVRYWDSAWQAIIFGSESAYLDRILAAGFDGVYLDIIDAFEYFEAQ
ncbi:endo alpha-1,4 polygalactosaminidase [Candidatus Hydrogenedentota bacterium]